MRLVPEEASVFKMVLLSIALGEATAKATVLEQELNKAQKVIQKSRKTSEVQNLFKDNESLQRKLASQEDEFRIQNQTLLNELTKVRILEICFFAWTPELRIPEFRNG